MLLVKSFTPQFGGHASSNFTPGRHSVLQYYHPTRGNQREKILARPPKKRARTKKNCTQNQKHIAQVQVCHEEGAKCQVNLSIAPPAGSHCLLSMTDGTMVSTL